jgi:hypothetical protein
MSTIEELEAQLASLRAEVHALRATATPQPAPTSGRVLTRRNLLRAAPAVAVGAGIAALSAAPAVADTGDALLLGESNTASFTLGVGDVTTLVTPLTVESLVNIDTLVVAPEPSNSATGAALTITAGVTGFHPFGQDGLSVSTTDGGTGIQVSSGDGPGFDNVNGVQGVAISATVDAGQILVAETTSTTSPHEAITVTYAGTSRALYAESTLTTNINGTITGVNDGSGIGVWGENKNTTAAGIGVVGIGNAFGRGGRFAGGKANVQLTPSSASSHPSFTGHVGDLFVDSSARLWFCKKTNTSSVAAVWHQIA